MLDTSRFFGTAEGNQTTWPNAGNQTADVACESSLVARAVSLLNRPPGLPRERRPELATLNTPPSSCIPLSRCIDGSLLKPPVVPSQSGLPSPAGTTMLVDIFSESLPIDCTNLGSASAMMDFDASLQSLEEMMSSCNEAVDMVQPTISECEAAVRSADDMKRALYTAEYSVPSVTPMQLSSTFGDTNCWPALRSTDSGREFQLDNPHALKQEDPYLCEPHSMYLPPSGFQSAIARFSPSTASEASLVTNEDWFALLDLGDGVESSTVFDAMPWGPCMLGPLTSPSFEVLNSTGQQLPSSSGCGNDEVSNQYATASSQLYHETAASAAYNRFNMDLRPRPQTDMIGLCLDSDVLAEVNSLTFPMTPATTFPLGTLDSASNIDFSLKESTGAVSKIQSTSAEKGARLARDSNAAKILAGNIAPRILEHDSANSDGDTIVADAASQPVSSRTSGHPPAKSLAVPINDVSEILRDSAGPVPNRSSTGKESGTAVSKPPPKRRPKSKIGPRLLCHQPGCGKSFSSQHNLNEHQQVHEYPRVQRYFCREGQCALELKGFNFKRDLMRHYRQKHPWVAERLKEEAARQVEERRAAIARKKEALAAAGAAARERVAEIKKAQTISFRIEREANGSWSGTMDSEMQVIDGR